jgi:molybdenum cofactor cytidylyltransferase
LRRPGAQGSDTSRLIAGVLLAAGQSARFGRQKLLEAWHGEPLVRNAARSLIGAGLQPVVVVVSTDERLRDALAELPLTIVENAHPENGISSSIAVGLRALPETATAALLAVSDQPHLTAAAIEQLVDAFQPGRIVVPRFGDHRGNPPVFDRRFFPELLALAGDQGGQRVITAHAESVTEVSLSASLGDDIDRPQEWPV